MVVVAVVVSGKSSRAWRLLIALSKSIANELKPRGMPSRAAHGIGWRAWARTHEEWNAAGYCHQVQDPSLHANEDTEVDDGGSGKHAHEEATGQHQHPKHLHHHLYHHHPPLTTSKDSQSEGTG